MKKVKFVIGHVIYRNGTKMIRLVSSFPTRKKAEAELVKFPKEYQIFETDTSCSSTAIFYNIKQTL